jgi:hypothetical protein
MYGFSLAVEGTLDEAIASTTEALAIEARERLQRVYEDLATRQAV